MIDFSSELKYTTSRSSGAGGQNVNKVETAVTVQWKVVDSCFFSEDKKELIAQRLQNRINSEGVLQITASNSRTQIQNKKMATARILELVHKATYIPKTRKTTQPSKRQIQKRLDQKKKISEKKENRKFRI